MKRIITLAICLVCLTQIMAQDASELYIDLYAPIAISEMHRTGIPASIKLAQGILESNSGRSEMAKAANNHFGIKCGGTWMGGSYFKEDDDRDHRGRIVESCFRTYADAESSYIAHSDFLTNNGKATRYGFLFEYDQTEYKKWAKGLRKAGYATDPHYPKKLITIIEKYELYYFDRMDRPSDAVIAAQRPNPKETITPSGQQSRILNDNTVNAAYNKPAIPDYKVYNNVKMVLTTGVESLQDIASEYKKDVAYLARINHFPSTDSAIPAKSRIYLEPKKLNFKGKKKYHQVREGEDMEDISQHYAVDLEALYIKNRMPFGSQPVPGERIQLKGLMRTGKRPRLLKKQRQGIVEKSRFVEETVEYIFGTKNSDKD